MAFVHETLPQRVALERGGAARRLADEVARLGARRVMVIAAGSASAVADHITSGLPEAVRWHEVRQHVPVELAERARAAAAEASVDAIVTVGGGSTTGLGKAVALTTGLPIIAVPTTYAGSEATPVWGLTEGRVKRTGTDQRVLPVAVVYDSELSSSLPVGLAVASGLNALAHSVDSLWAPGADPINQALGLEGVRALAVGLPRLVADADDADDADARDQALYGCYLSAVSFASAGSGMHHKICHVLGGAYDLPHAQTHAIVLPHVLAYNAPAVPRLAGRLAEALGGSLPGGQDDAAVAAAAVDALEALRLRLGAPRALRDYGLAEADLPEAAARCLAAIPESNPVPVTEASLAALLGAAWAGRQPTIRSER
jgi:alcohol dehydrogenase class IV